MKENRNSTLFARLASLLKLVEEKPTKKGVRVAT